MGTAQAQCASQASGEPSLGAFATPELCAGAAGAAGCGAFMHSESQPQWGCRCCVEADPPLSHEYWTVYPLTQKLWHPDNYMENFMVF